jgi:hypothetical protein
LTPLPRPTNAVWKPGERLLAEKVSGAGSRKSAYKSVWGI